MNDGGKYVTEKDIRQDMYLDFLDGGRELQEFEALRKRDGLYHHRDIMIDRQKVRLILLDTRTHRDSTWIRSVGESTLPLSALVAAAIRVSTALLGFGRDYGGDVLGEQQWQWLEEVLRTSDADYHVVVSSIQVLTANPVFESWTHFPVSKRRLMDILLSVNPRGFVFISGDVHFAEFNQVIIREKGTGSKVGSVFEVTSSGLTHSCATSRVIGWICPVVLALFDNRRAFPGAVYTGRNVARLGFNQSDARIDICDVNDFRPNCSLMSYDFSPVQLYPGNYHMADIEIALSSFGEYNAGIINAILIVSISVCFGFFLLRSFYRSKTT